MPNRDHLRRSVAARRSSGRFGRALRVLGPGIITGAADDDPAGIITSSPAGARIGYVLAAVLAPSGRAFVPSWRCITHIQSTRGYAAILVPLSRATLSTSIPVAQ